MHFYVSTTFTKVFPDAWAWFIGWLKNKFIYKKLYENSVGIQKCKYIKEDFTGNVSKISIYFDFFKKSLPVRPIEQFKLEWLHPTGVLFSLRRV